MGFVNILYFRLIMHKFPKIYWLYKPIEAEDGHAAWHNPVCMSIISHGRLLAQMSIPLIIPLQCYSLLFSLFWYAWLRDEMLIWAWCLAWQNADLAIDMTRYESQEQLWFMDCSVPTTATSALKILLLHVTKLFLLF